MPWIEGYVHRTARRIALLRWAVRPMACWLPVVLAVMGCSPETARGPAPAVGQGPPSILLVTLDTTRADHLGIESGTEATPNLDSLAKRGLWFTQAYSTAPMTLPAHTSMMTGLYPAEHGIHENGRNLAGDTLHLGDHLRQAGYRTAAIVSGFPLSRQFGLARGFDHFDDEFADSPVERRAGPTTDRALEALRGSDMEPQFLWVHYFDPHEPYDPPEPFLSRYPEEPYLGEIAYMDHELGRLVESFEMRFAESGARVLVVGDHGESLGDHGESLHGNLLYQGVMRVPMIIAGTGIEPVRLEGVVSSRRVFDTVLAWAGLESAFDLSSGGSEVVLGEALKPHLQYGWQPQVMAVSDDYKMIRSGETEVFDVRSDPAESRNLVGEVDVAPELARAIRDYPIAPPANALKAQEAMSQETRERLASLGYIGLQNEPSLRQDAPSPKDMTHLFRALDTGSALFIQKKFRQAIPIFEGVLEADPGNLVVNLRLAVAHSVLGDEDLALEYFERAREIGPSSVDARHYLAMHYVRSGRPDLAGPLFESVLIELPRRLPALEGLSRIRESEGQLDEAAGLLERITELRDNPANEWIRLGQLRMALGETPTAIDAFESARAIQGAAFAHWLELGVCYLADRRFAQAADALDLVSPSHPGYPMALFKRAQASVLLGEPDRAERIRAAYEGADPSTLPLIRAEKLFK